MKAKLNFGLGNIFQSLQLAQLRKLKLSTNLFECFYKCFLDSLSKKVVILTKNCQINFAQDSYLSIAFLAQISR